jgi:RNA polymerase sigma factor (TIGR02999 family)
LRPNQLDAELDRRLKRLSYNRWHLRDSVKPASQQLTRLLLAWTDGDAAALEELTRAVHVELQRLARRYMRDERPGHTLQTTALVNEAYLRLIDWKNVEWKNRAHFFAVAGQIMRRILVDHARSRQNQKRGGNWRRVSFDEAALVFDGESPDLVALDEALRTLESADPRKGRVVELRFFAGLSVQETADVLGVSTDTVLNDWRTAKAWLLRELIAGTGHAR